MWLIYFLFKNENRIYFQCTVAFPEVLTVYHIHHKYRIVKPVEITIKRRLRAKGEK
jgi:hypothetical protein